MGRFESYPFPYIISMKLPFRPSFHIKGLMTPLTMGEISRKDNTAVIRHYRPSCLLFPTVLTAAIVDMTQDLVQTTAATALGGAESAPTSTANDIGNGDGNG